MYTYDYNAISSHASIAQTVSSRGCIDFPVQSMKKDRRPW
jgi:hypothetical protein